MSHATALTSISVGHLEQFNPLDLALAGFLARYRGTTFYDYRTDLRIYFEWCEQNGLPPLQARRPHLELYVRWLEERGWASSTINRRFGTVAVFYKYATVDEIIEKDPSVHVTRPAVRREEQKRTVMTPLQYACFLEAARAMGVMEHALAALGGMLGLRVSEMCSLNVDSLGVAKGHDVIRFVGKNSKYAEMPVPVPVMRALRAAIGERTEGPILLSKTGTRMDRQCASRMVKRIADRAKINTEVSPHSLRRTFCTSGLSSGIPLVDMQRAMRHQDPKTTVIYDVSVGNHDRHAAPRVAAYLAGIAG